MKNQSVQCINTTALYQHQSLVSHCSVSTTVTGKSLLCINNSYCSVWTSLFSTLTDKNVSRLERRHLYRSIMAKQKYYEGWTAIYLKMDVIKNNHSSTRSLTQEICTCCIAGIGISGRLVENKNKYTKVIIINKQRSLKIKKSKGVTLCLEDITQT